MALPRQEYEKGILELLYDYHSDETKKNKRNLVITCFIIISCYFLGVSLSELKVLGVNLAKGDDTKIIIIALMLVNYWYILFHIYFRQDVEIHNERQHVLNNHILTITNRQEELESRGDLDRLPGYRKELKDIQETLEIYENQSGRLNLARKLMLVSRSFEQIFPVILFIITLYLLLQHLLWA